MPQSLKSAIAIVAVLLVMRLATTDPWHCITQDRLDFHCYWSAGRAIIENRSPFDSGHTIAWLYPPTSNWWATFVGLLPLDAARLIWYGLLACSVVLWLFQFGVISGRGWKGQLLCILVFLVPLKHALTMGQVHPITTAMVFLSATAMLRGYGDVAGFLAALSILIKPWDALYLLPLALVYGDRSMLVDFAEWMFLGLAISAFIFGGAEWSRFIDVANTAYVSRHGMVPQFYGLAASLWLAMAIREEER